MLIINKKYSNLLKGYQRALELDQKLDSDWESKYKPALLSKLHETETEQMMDYQEKLLTWQKSEKLSIAQWEEAERMKFSEWESNEIVRQSIYASESTMYRAKSQLHLEQQKSEKNTWMIAWIGSAVLSIGLFFLLDVFVKIGVFFGILGFLSALGMCVFSIVTFILFLVKSGIAIKPLPRYIPAPKPQPARRVSESQPVAPLKSENLIENYSYPSVISRWQETIQYKDHGNEYFRNLVQEKPDTLNGTPGEMALLQNIASIDNRYSDQIEENGIYILGLKIGEKADIDGTLISTKGIWLLESKYLTGKILYNFGQWKHIVFVKNPRHQALEGWQEKVYEKPIELDKQWFHEKASVEKMLSKKLVENPWLQKLIKGGLIFTHPNIELDITNCPVFYTSLWFIKNGIEGEIHNQELTFEKRLEIADVLLAGNRKFEKEDISAVKMAEDIYNEITVYLKNRNNNPSIY